MSDKTIAEQLDAAKSGEEFGQVVSGLFYALDMARQIEEGCDGKCARFECICPSDDEEES